MAASRLHSADAIEKDPGRGPRCRGDACTSAHSTVNELDASKTQLEEWRQLQRDSANLRTPKYEEPSEELVLWRQQEQQSDLVMSPSQPRRTKSDLLFEPKKLASPNVAEEKTVLSQQNYKPKFHSLLRWEEKYHIGLLSQW